MTYCTNTGVLFNLKLQQLCSVPSPPLRAIVSVVKGGIVAVARVVVRSVGEGGCSSASCDRIGRDEDDQEQYGADYNSDVESDADAGEALL